jgi:Fe-S-cluster containining protein
VYYDPLIIIPAMPECDGCGRCCGPVGCTAREADKIAAYMLENAVVWKARDGGRDWLLCGFLGANKRCMIYPVRPLTCQLYGVIHEMTCPFYPKSARMSMPADRLVELGYDPEGPLLAQVFGGMP